MIDKNHPCKKDCPRRSGTCKATCQGLADYLAAKRDAIEAREAERRRENLIADYVSETISATRRKARR